MRLILQRVRHASVTIDGKLTAEIGTGLMILLGVKEGDTEKQADFLAGKASELRIFTDANDKMNLSLLDVDGSALVVSNFTLYADSRKGRRPSFVHAARPETAEPLYTYFIGKLRKAGVREVQTGVFGADMQVDILNDGPVTVLLDTDEMMP